MMTVSIVSPNAPMKVNATIRCASVGFGRKATPAFAAPPPSVAVGRCAGSVDFGSVGGAVTVGRPQNSSCICGTPAIPCGRVLRLPFSRDHARRDHTLNVLHGTLGLRHHHLLRGGEPTES